MKCKSCNKKEAIQYSKYSTGEFCSRKCARAFSTKNKRQEINEKVSKSLTGRELSDEHVKNISKNSARYWLGKNKSEEIKEKIALSKFKKSNSKKKQVD